MDKSATSAKSAIINSLVPGAYRISVSCSSDGCGQINKWVEFPSPITLLVQRPVISKEEIKAMIDNEQIARG